MEFKKIKNKNNEVLTTKEGKELIEMKFTKGDTFIPQYNKVLEKVNDAEVKGVTKRITNYSLKCVVKDEKGQTIKNEEGNEEIFVSLTPTQAKSLKNKINGYTDKEGNKHEPIEITQHVFVAYEYESEEYGPQIGVGIKKDYKEPKKFKDFETTEEKVE